MKPRARHLWLLALAAVVAAIFAAPAAAETGEPALSASFERSLAGWRGSRSSLSSARGIVGQRAARVAARAGAATFSIYLSRPLAATRSGSVYVAGGWVRGAAGARTVCLQVREAAGGAPVGSARTCLASTTRWKRLPAIRYRAKTTGGTLGISVTALRRGAGDVFVVDGLRVRTETPPATSSGPLAAALPAPLPESLGRTFYVAKAGCSDAGAGTLSAPWCTLRKALGTVAAGDRVLVRGGTYAEPVQVLRSGSSSAPITVEGYPGERAVLTKQFTVDASWIRVTALVFDGKYELDTTLIYVRGAASDVEISDNEITRAGLPGTTAKDGNGIYSDPGTRNVQIVRNFIHANGTWARYHHGVYLNGRGHLLADNLIVGNAAYGVQLYPGCYGAIVSGNTIVGHSRSAITLGSEGGTPSNGNRIVNNVLAYNGEEGISTWWGGARGYDNVVQGNLIWGNAGGGTYGGGMTVSQTIAADPRFVDRAAGDYRPAAGSPAVDAALPAYAPAVDRDGRARIEAPDVGALEAG